jgi:arylamine N-acetyltransferase
MLKVDCRTSVVTSLRSEDGRLVLRMNELEGRQDHIVIEKEEITKAHITDLAGNRIGEVCVDQHRAEFDLSPLSLAQVVLE